MLRYFSGLLLGTCVVLVACMSLRSLPKLLAICQTRADVPTLPAASLFLPLSTGEGSSSQQ